jgi:hypothetical protein
VQVYLFDDTLMNESIYSDPMTWDPARYLPDRSEDKNLAAHGYIGWGSGLHPCGELPFGGHSRD